MGRHAQGINFIQKDGATLRFGHEAEWLDRDAVQREVASPTYHAGVFRRTYSVVDPARVAWGLCDAARRLGVRVYEGTRVDGIRASGSGIVLPPQAARDPASKARTNSSLIFITLSFVCAQAGQKPFKTKTSYR